MKKYFGIILVIFLAAPFFRASADITATTLVITFNPNHQTGHFLFSFSVEEPDGSFSITSSNDINATADTDLVTISQANIGWGTYKLELSSPDGSTITKFDCSNEDGVDTFDPISTGYLITIQSNAGITCDVESKAAPVKTPILIVPGVLGTDLSDSSGNLLWANEKMTLESDSFMDPLIFSDDLLPVDSISATQVIRSKTFFGKGLHYSDNLIKDLTSQGYIEGKDLFTFPYDWRYGVTGLDVDGNEVNVNALKGQIDFILSKTGADHVDIVAHSTGGLIVKKYVMEHPTDNHIGKAVFVGVPNEGAPKAVKVLLQGDNFDIPGLNDAEMKKFAQNMPVVYDLAPDRQYIDTVGDVVFSSDTTTSPPFAVHYNFDQTRTYLEGKGENELAMTNAENLHTADFDNFDMRTAGVDAYNIVGCKTPTFDQVEERTYYKSKFLFGTEKITGYFLSKLASGDGTVPFESANSNIADAEKTFYAPGSSHGTLLTSDGTRQEIVNILTGTALDTDGKIITKDKLLSDPSVCELSGGKLIAILSPVNISVTDDAGNTLGFADDGSIQNDIPGADFEIWDEHKFVFLPNGGNYTISLQGTGDGTFTLIDQDMADGVPTDDGVVFSDVPVKTGMTGSVDLSSATISWNDQVLTPGEYTPATTEPDAPVEGGPVPAGASIFPDPTAGKVLGDVTYSDGTLVLDSTDGRTVYLIYHNKKYGFTSDKIFLASGFNFSEVITGHLSQMPLGGLLQ